jgi:hypothetical protein
MTLPITYDEARHDCFRGFSLAVPWLRQIAAGLSPWRLGLGPFKEIKHRVRVKRYLIENGRFDIHMKAKERPWT